jgi:hypothetical protein
MRLGGGPIAFLGGEIQRALERVEPVPATPATVERATVRVLGDRMSATALPRILH